MVYRLKTHLIPPGPRDSKIQNQCIRHQISNAELLSRIAPWKATASNLPGLLGPSNQISSGRDGDMKPKGQSAPETFGQSISWHQRQCWWDCWPPVGIKGKTLGFTDGDSSCSCCKIPWTDIQIRLVLGCITQQSLIICPRYIGRRPEETGRALVTEQTSIPFANKASFCCPDHWQ